MARSTKPVEVPGAPGEASPIEDADGDKDAIIANLRAQLAARNEFETAPSMVIEADTPHGRIARAESKHLGYTCAELHAEVVAGNVALRQRSVLCRDGWYVNPSM